MVGYWAWAAVVIERATSAKPIERSSSSFSALLWRQRFVQNSSWRHALLSEDRGGVRGLQKVEKSLGGRRILAVGRDGAGEDELVLQVAGEGPGELHARRDQHVGQKHAELGLAFGDSCRNGRRRSLRFGLGLYLIGDAEPLEPLDDIGAGGARRQERDRLRLEQRLLE